VSQAAATTNLSSEGTRIQPASHRLESRLIAALVGLIVLGTVGTAWLRGGDDTEDPLFDWQISAFYDLNAANQAVYNALLVASDELWYSHWDLLQWGTEEERARPWPAVADLDEFYLMPPFTRDVAWQQQGQIQWELVAWFGGERLDGSAVYFGSGGSLEDQSAYLLVLSHVHKGASYTDGAQIWIHDDTNVTAPAPVTRDSLIVNGWKEVVPYSGAMEVERLRG